MKKKIVMLALSVLVAMSAMTGCGKSDEEKARDEIMSHMDADEKANIAADQKEIAEYEAEKQAKQEAIENEKPIDYSEVLEERELSDYSFITYSGMGLPDIPISILMPNDEYLFSDKSYNREQDFANGTFAYGQNQLAYLTIIRPVPISEVTGDIEDLGNYSICIRPDTSNTSMSMNYLFVFEKDSDYALKITYQGNADYYDTVIAVLEKNYEHIKAQLQ